MLKELAKQYAPASVLGVLLGIALVVWIEPATTGGAALLVAVAVLICIAISIGIRIVRPAPKKESEAGEK